MAGGRPSKYYTHVEPKLLLVAAWCRNGLTDIDICKNLDIGKDAFIEYKKTYSELSDILKLNKEVVDTQVENALLKAAMGYTIDEHTYEGGELTKTVVKEVAPNTTALIFWLKNRNKEAWRDTQNIDHSGKLALDVDIDRMDDNEILIGIETAIQAINNLKK